MGSLIVVTGEELVDDLLQIGLQRGCVEIVNTL
jgi:hypothetical protein